MQKEIKCPKCLSPDYFITKEGIVCEDCNEIFFVEGFSYKHDELPDIDPKIIEN